MEQNKSSAKRIQWLDICRGILIILMVTGHSTGLFNKYIYQFHMAAFFFLSGYMSQPEKRGMFQTLFDKFFTVLLPAVTTVLFGLVLLWLAAFRRMGYACLLMGISGLETCAGFALPTGRYLGGRIRRQLVSHYAVWRMHSKQAYTSADP